MATGPRYRVHLRRRKEGKTDYYQRRELLKSQILRLVIRKSSKHIRVQFIEARPNGDITLNDTSSYSLKDYKWQKGTGNIPASYLTGYLAGKKAMNAGINKAILDLGLQTNAHGGRIYAALKGIIDAGIEIPANDTIFPADEIIHGSHIESIESKQVDGSKSAIDKKF